jgi:hypothetical protein
MIDGDKSLSDLTTEALAMAKEQVKASANAAAQATANTKPADVTAGMTPEQVAAVKDGLAAQASAQNSIVGGASSQEASDAKNLEILCKSVADKFYKRG